MGVSAPDARREPPASPEKHRPTSRPVPGPGSRIAAIGALRIAIDGTPLLGHRTGVGEVTAGVLAELAGRADTSVVAYALTLRGRAELRDRVPDGISTATRPFPATLVRELWGRGMARPRIEDWTGNVDVVHATNFVAPPTRARVVVTVHDVTFIRFPELCTPDTLRYRELLARAIARGAVVHTPSQFVAAEVRDAFAIEPDRVVSIPSGVPPVTGGDAARGRALIGADRYVLALGTIEPRKNLTTLVDAFAIATRSDPELHLVLAGPPGWDANRVETAIAASPARDRIHRLGFVSGRDRADLLSGAAVFAYPSLYEGFGFPPLEAMQCGVPVVASTAGSLPEVLGDAASLVSPADPELLAQEVARLSANSTERDELIARGHRQVARYSWVTTVDKLLHLYRSLQ